MWLMLACVACLATSAALADIVVSTRTIRPGERIDPADLVSKQIEVAGAAQSHSDLVGMEARVAIYPGRPIRFADVGPPAIVDRNQLVVLFYQEGGLQIRTEGRALGRGAEGDVIRVMNLTSRNTLSGRVNADGTIRIK